MRGWGGGGNRLARRASLSFALGQLVFFRGASFKQSILLLHRHEGYHLVCIRGSLVKFQGGGVGGIVLKTMLCARVWILMCFCTRADPCLSKLRVSLKLSKVCV